jgi:hypothetical protein
MLKSKIERRVSEMVRHRHHSLGAFFRDGHDEYSSKRLFAIGSGLMVFVSALMSIFFHMNIAEFIFHGLMAMAMFGIFNVTAEGWAPNFGSAEEHHSDHTEEKKPEDDSDKTLIGRSD